MTQEVSHLSWAAWRVFFALPLLVACSSAPPNTPPQPTASGAPGAQLVQEGQRFAAQGQSVRAEQYYLAGVRAGAPRHEVYRLLIQSCVESGRLRSALSHVRTQLRYAPDDAQLHQLAASLALALGQLSDAWQHVDALEHCSEPGAPTLQFLADFFEVHGGDDEKALHYYRQALRRGPGSSDAAFLRSAVRRLQRKAELEANIMAAATPLEAKND